ncbi:glycoside hydrolase family 2 [Arthrobacter sp. BB-1]|uniref:glycoside hydrolase family 2 protein n=1 Tax=Micrococcaceae TaxID=1268 RepID=UPI001112A2CF|nr:MULTISPECIES: glycoside hydrolase family 2 TIM barrel-domain containing protein [Micrococcaceae]TNB69424.1 glycoside hydrolase family 2 [Arthrobacter sp. BB-1]UEL28124.1 glycoside hydrolase family 2 [Pseudarthrobacter sp. L1SW]
MHTDAAPRATDHIRASRSGGTYPRPQLVRGAHHTLDVVSGFAYDDDDRGRFEHWELRPDVFTQRIQLPFAPESAASGIGDTGYHPIVWYRIALDESALDEAGRISQGDTILLHFGAVDYAADVWVDGQHVGSHEGGQTAFSIDITTALGRDTEDHSIVVRAQDDPLDVTVPRGKQDWQVEPHSIWYHRTTGIWRTVWVEAVPALHVRHLSWTPNVPEASVRAELELSHRPLDGASVDVTLSLDGHELARQQISVHSDQIVLDIPLQAQRNGQNYEQMLWSPEHPRLIDATVTVTDAMGTSDVVASYLGLRSVAAAHGTFLLNDRPTYVRSVLEQGYWPQSHYTAPTLEALREEVELIKSLGFNAARIHQKVEDPRFLYWCDRLGLMIWGETAGAYEFNPLAVSRLTKEWVDIVRSSASHPSIITWVPLNESWGVQHGAHSEAQRSYGLALANLTRALDPSRPVISNDGWEHTDSEIWTFHDYEHSGEILRQRYGSKANIDAMIRGIGPAGRRMSVIPEPDTDRPVMLTEFGGISYAPGTAFDDSWGYSAAANAVDFQDRLSAILDAVNASAHLSGFCYTQITDTRQETNGLCDENRKPKLPVAALAQIITGRPCP